MSCDRRWQRRRKIQLIFTDYFHPQPFLPIYSLSHMYERSEIKFKNMFLTELIAILSILVLQRHVEFVERIETICFFRKNKILKAKNVTYENISQSHSSDFFCNTYEKKLRRRKLKFSGYIIFIGFLSWVGAAVTLMQSRNINFFRLEFLFVQNIFSTNIFEIFLGGRWKIKVEEYEFN